MTEGSLGHVGHREHLAAPRRLEFRPRDVPQRSSRTGDHRAAAVEAEQDGRRAIFIFDDRRQRQTGGQGGVDLHQPGQIAELVGLAAQRDERVRRAFRQQLLQVGGPGAVAAMIPVQHRQARHARRRWALGGHEGVGAGQQARPHLDPASRERGQLFLDGAAIRFRQRVLVLQEAIGRRIEDGFPAPPVGNEGVEGRLRQLEQVQVGRRQGVGHARRPVQQFDLTDEVA